MSPRFLWPACTTHLCLDCRKETVPTAALIAVLTGLTSLVEMESEKRPELDEAAAAVIQADLDLTKRKSELSAARRAEASAPPPPPAPYFNTSPTL